MEVLEIVLATVLAPLAVAGILSCLHLLRKADKRMAVDELRWQQNEAEHRRAFQKIADLRAGQEKIAAEIAAVKTQLEHLQASLRTERRAANPMSDAPAGKI